MGTDNIYESERLVSEYLLFHYGKPEQILGWEFGPREALEFPARIVREKCAGAHSVVVVEMNMGQIVNEVKTAVDNPDQVYLANRIDGSLITPTDIRNILRLIQGKGV